MWLTESLDQISALQRGLKRSREGSSSRKRVWHPRYMINLHFYELLKQNSFSFEAALCLYSWTLHVLSLEIYDKYPHYYPGMYFVASFHSSRVEGEPVHWNAVKWQLHLLPNWTTSTGLKPGRAGSNNATNSCMNVSLIPLLLLVSFPVDTHSLTVLYCFILNSSMQLIQLKLKKTSFSATLLSWTLLCLALSEKFDGQTGRPTVQTASCTSVWEYSRCRHSVSGLQCCLLFGCFSEWTDLVPLSRFGQYLFMKGRIENIFTDGLYRQFATEITVMLRLWKPKLLPNGTQFFSV